LTHWIRDYVFMTSYKAAAIKFPGRARYWSYALLFLSLLVVGVWHGATMGFVMFGALNGLGAAVTRAHGDGLRALLGGAGLKAYLRNRSIHGIAVLVTLHYVGFCFLFFSLSLHQVRVLLGTAWSELLSVPSSLGNSAWSAQNLAPVLAVSLAVVVLWTADSFGSVLGRLASRITQRSALMSSMLCAQTTAVVLILYFEWAFQQEAPPVLYMSF
jgi:D-alanyl-lipoteichoic acid acyltransferase DltB (MBOAT superfamily)